ncbi:MAG: hypothetical protein PHE73_08745 [Sulfurovaceae bacterium]|nr:hypothetical protein [Sulfurovaceae bacterium]
MTYLCIKCDEVFQTELDYENHKAEVHQGFAPNQTDLPQGITPEMLPTPEFVDTVKRLEKPQKIINNPRLKEESVVVKLQENIIKSTENIIPSLGNKLIEPIKLNYQFTGQCKCGNNVSTLEVDAGGKHFAIAFCQIENKQIESREVVKLEEKAIKRLENLQPEKNSVITEIKEYTDKPKRKYTKKHKNI